VAGAVSRRFDAVVFDLFGTLVSEFSSEDWSASFERLAAIFGVEVGAFRDAWSETSIERQTGRLGDIRRNLLENAWRAGGDPTDEQIDAAIAVRAELYAKYFRPLPGALETVRWVRERGYRSALVSMCAPDTPELWRASPFAGSIEVEVFSCEVGHRKPHPEIYLAAADGLGVEPSRCLYVGDGSYGELRGASAVGMTAVLVRDPDEAEGSMLRPEYEPWDGVTIDSIADLPSVIETTSPTTSVAGGPIERSRARNGSDASDPTTVR
jgi:putative hydrolase of the HAD superfamily